MRPELFRLTFDLRLSLWLLAAGLFVAFFLPWNRGWRPAEALRRALRAVLTCGLGAPKDDVGPDLFLPGALGFLLGVLPLLIVIAKGPFDVPVASYPFTLALGFVCAIAISTRRAKARGIAPAHVLDIAIICLIAGPVGARAFFVWQYKDEHFTDKAARLVLSEPVRPLGSGDELVLTTEAGEARASFAGTEKTSEELLARIAPTLSGARARATLVTLDRRIGDEVVHIVRGIAVETLDRGARASISASGPAAAKLGIEGTIVRGQDIPWTRMLEIWNGGIVFYGGLLFATAAGLAYVWSRGYRILAVADVIAPVLALGLAFGRVGCTLNGCCWGRPVDPSFPFAIRFPVFSHPWWQHARSVLPATMDNALEEADRTHAFSEAVRTKLGDLCTGSAPVHAVQIYDIVLEIGLFFVILAFGRFFTKREGATFFLFFWTYGITRFILEHFRGDHPDFVVMWGYPLTMSQRVALITVPLGLAGFIATLLRGRAIETQVVAPTTVETNSESPR